MNLQEYTRHWKATSKHWKMAKGIVSQGKRIGKSMEVGAKLWRIAISEGDTMWMEEKGIIYNLHFTELCLEKV